MNHMLDAHGTKLHELKPASIIAAAQADLRRRTDNRATLHRGPGREHYAFHRLHVRKADCVADILAVAQRDRQRGVQSGKRMTRLIYADVALLERTAELAKAEATA